jgi:GH35 family endo-1,4-beta-xylanase
MSTRGAARSDFATFWNQFTPENEGKWGSIQPNQATFNWAALDREYAYAQSNNLIFKQHNFIWGKQQPNWVNNGNAQTAVQTWMTTFCQRYPNTKLIDVVNEPPAHHAGVHQRNRRRRHQRFRLDRQRPQDGARRLSQRDPHPERLQQHRVDRRKRPHH